jgi:hypothetical protein
MQALEEDDENPRSHPREPRRYRERMAREPRSEETALPILVMKKRKEADDAGERQERVAP